MCTLSWWIEKERRGVLFNRDEKRARTHGLPPVRLSAAGGMDVLAPVDPEAGGTWIGVNAAGLIAGLLNFYPHRQGEVPGRRSRGMLVLDLLYRYREADAAFASLTPQSLQAYRGFIVFLMDRSGSIRTGAWDGNVMRTPAPGEADGVLATSSFEPEASLRQRLDLFAGVEKEPEALRRIHEHYDSGASAVSPLMSRDDAATDSITEVTVDGKGATMCFRPVRGRPPVPGKVLERRLPVDSLWEGE